MTTKAQLFRDDLIDIMRQSDRYGQFVILCRERGIDPASITTDELSGLQQLVKKFHYRSDPSTKNSHESSSQSS